MLVGFGWMAQAHMQQMAATGVAPAGCSVSIAMASGAAGGMVADGCGGMLPLAATRATRTNGYDAIADEPESIQTAPEWWPACGDRDGCRGAGD